MSYGIWKHIWDVFNFQNSISNGILVIKRTLRDPLIRDQPQLLTFFFFSFFTRFNEFGSSSSFLFPFTLGLVWSSSSFFFFSFFLSFSIQTIPTNFSIQTISKKKKKKRNCWNEKKINPDRSLLRYKKQKNEDSNIEVTDSNLKSNQTKNPKKKKCKRDLSMARHGTAVEWGILSSAMSNSARQGKWRIGATGLRRWEIGTARLRRQSRWSWS